MHLQFMAAKTKKRSVLIIYTGGTIGMVEDSETGVFKPFNFAHLYQHVPEIKKFDLTISSIAFEKPIDSSNINPEIWVKLAKMIEDDYEKYDGFVILHGSDTMAYTASALSFMLENLSKPVILTGSQLPIGVIRTDGKENLITSIEIASDYKNGQPLVPEVAVYFEYQLYRGNRTHKYNAEHFEAFESPNYPILAEAGVRIQYNEQAIRKISKKPLVLHTTFDTNIAILHLFPGINKNFIRSVFETPSLRALILVTYGAGNAPADSDLTLALEQAEKNHLLVLNVTQCNRGIVEPKRYETNACLVRIGVNGKDITLEAAITKLMLLLGENTDFQKLKSLLAKPLAGEMII